MAVANITAENQWTAEFRVPATTGSRYLMMLGIRGTWSSGTQVTVQWWRPDQTSTEAVECLSITPSDGGSHLVEVAGPIIIRAGVKTGYFTTSDNFYVDLG